MARREETSVAASGSSATLCFGGDEPSAPVPAGCNADNVRHERNFYKFGATRYGQSACNYFGPSGGKPSAFSVHLRLRCLTWSSIWATYSLRRLESLWSVTITSICCL